MLLITPIHVIPNLYDFLFYVEHKSMFVHTLKRSLEQHEVESWIFFIYPSNIIDTFKIAGIIT